jgi:hypothetical protein
MRVIPEAMESAHALPTSRDRAVNVVLVSSVVVRLLKYADTLRLNLNFSERQIK